MEQRDSGHIMDITFVGSGIATTFALIPLLQSLKGNEELKGIVRIAIIEKEKELFTGLAYGPRSGESALLITSLADFLPEGELRKEFISWLNLNHRTLVEDLRADGGPLSLNWIRTHKDEIEAGDWEDIYIPRRFFGKYLKEKMKKVIAETTDNDRIELNFIRDEVDALEKINNRFSISFKSDRDTMVSSKVVLAVGIPPSKQYWGPEEEKILADRVCLISDLYNPGLTENLKKIESFTGSSDSINVLIIGANASAMEIIYKLNDDQSIRNKLGDFTVISPQGELPNSVQDDFTRMVKFVPENLAALKKKQDVTAWEIFKAANLDLDAAEDRGYGTGISEVPISRGFISLLGKLNKQELAVFASHYGNEIGKRQRRAGQHYIDVIDHLKAQNRLSNIKGYFTGLNIQDDLKGVKFKYKSDNGKAELTSEKDFDLIISCSGSKTLDEEEIPELLVQLIKSGLCEINPSRRGFVADDNLMTSSGLYIAGPLLAGNVIGGVPFWHLEHCGRIIALGKELAARLLNERELKL